MSNKLSTKSLRDKFEDIIVNLGYTLVENSDDRHIYNYKNFNEVILTYPQSVIINPFGIFVDKIKNCPFYEEIKNFSFVTFKDDKVYIGMASFDRHFYELVKIVKMVTVYFNNEDKNDKMKKFVEKIIECRYGNK